jgi:dimethylhistidine N-methyltransferase
VSSTDVLREVQHIPIEGRSPLRFYDYAPDTGSFAEDARAGLSAAPKTLPAKYFYDARGSALFDDICRVPAYYPTRTELEIMQVHAGDMALAVGADVLVIEYGSGSSLKTTRLLDALANPSAYVPVDISREHLLNAAKRLARAYPSLPVLPVCADYTTPFDVPEVPSKRRVAYYPGSTIGNFKPASAEAFLRDMRAVVGENGAALIGIDLQKDPAVLQAAYDDEGGVTAAFNKNILHRMARELDAKVNPEAFTHEARYNAEEGRMEMHLVSDEAQTIQIGEEEFALAAGESIHTENSYKYTLEGFAALAGEAGWTVADVWTDDRAYFSVHYLT